MAAEASALSRSARERLQRTRIVERYALARTAFRALCGIGIAWLAREAIADLAGRETSVTVATALSVVGELKVTIAITLAGGAAIWAVVERALRHRKTEALQTRIIDLEKSIDPRRSSSGLTPKGQTNPHDKRK
jgi:hypothetical protein